MRTYLETRRMSGRGCWLHGEGEALRPMLCDDCARVVGGARVGRLCLTEEDRRAVRVEVGGRGRMRLVGQLDFRRVDPWVG